MEPTLRPGDRLLVRYGSRVRPGVVVVARLPGAGLVVKRATERRPAGWWLLGDNPAGVDSRHRGAVGDDDVLARVLLRLWPRPAVLRRSRG